MSGAKAGLENVIIDGRTGEGVGTMWLWMDGESQRERRLAGATPSYPEEMEPDNAEGTVAGAATVTGSAVT